MRTAGPHILQHGQAFPGVPTTNFSVGDGQHRSFSMGLGPFQLTYQHSQTIPHYQRWISHNLRTRWTPLFGCTAASSFSQIRPLPNTTRIKCSNKGKRSVGCSLLEIVSNYDDIAKTLFSNFAASVVLLSLPNQVAALELAGQNFCQPAKALDISTLFKDDGIQEEGSQKMMMMMRGMTAKNFDPERYSGRWFEVASLKRGFAGQGQEDCHCTQGVYSFDPKTASIQVDTFCVHGGPNGYITGIRGKVQCLADEVKEKAETDLEMQEMIKAKCFLRFPTLPFIPKQPYDVIATDYDNFALVSGAQDRGFIQIYSRKPNPGAGFIDKYKSHLADFGYDPDQIKDTPQDCESMSADQLALMMSQPAMKRALTNQFPDPELTSAVQFDPFTSTLETLKKLLELYFKQIFGSK